MYPILEGVRLTDLQEEDFVTNLYHRDLLTDVDPTAIIDLLNQALEWLESVPELEESCRTALRTRLRVRRAFLSAVDYETCFSSVARPDLWKECVQLIATIRDTNDLGVSVQSAFSSKIQRRLASSVPPRPIVNIDFKDAYAFFVHTCTSAREAFAILQCSRAFHIMVVVQKSREGSQLM